MRSKEENRKELDRLLKIGFEPTKREWLYYIDSHSKEVAIAFDSYKRKNGWQYSQREGQLFRYSGDRIGKREEISVQELYTLFLKETEK